MAYRIRTECPFAYALGILGDKWTVLILREMFKHHKMQFNEFLEVEEGISSNILANRLKKMEEAKLITKTRNPNSRREWIYRPTEKALDLIPVLAELILWSGKYDPFTGVTKQHVEAITKDRVQFSENWKQQIREKFQNK